MEGKVGKSKEKNIYDFLKKNRFNVFSALLSVIAIIIALQANTYSRTATSAIIKIQDIQQIYHGKELESWSLGISACYDQNLNVYVIQFGTPGEFWISNTGGFNSTLLAVDFSSDIEITGESFLKNYFGDPNVSNRNWESKMYEHSTPYAPGSPIFLLEIPSGSSTPLYINSTASSYFQSPEDAVKYFNSLTHNTTNQNIEKTGVWTFRFGNGITFNKIYKTASIYPLNLIQNAPDNLMVQLKTPC